MYVYVGRYIVYTELCLLLPSSSCTQLACTYMHTYIPRVLYIRMYVCAYVVSRVVSSLNGDVLSNHMRTYVCSKGDKLQ